MSNYISFSDLLGGVKEEGTVHTWDEVGEERAAASSKARVGAVTGVTVPGACACFSWVISSNLEVRANK